MIQAEFDILTRDDLEKLKFVLDTNWDVAIRLLSSATSIAWGNLTWDIADQTDLQAELDAKEDSIWYTPENLANKNVINWYAWLWADWKINGSQLPVLAISETFVVASELEQLALTVQEWDVAVRTDENKSYIALNDTNALMSDWQLLLTPTDAVLSVAGKTWVVVLTSTDVWLWNVDNTSDADKTVSTATQTELNLKANLDWGNTFTGTEYNTFAWKVWIWTTSPWALLEVNQNSNSLALKVVSQATTINTTDIINNVITSWKLISLYTDSASFTWTWIQVNIASTSATWTWIRIYNSWTWRSLEIYWKVVLNSLPTSATGLSSWDVWRNWNVLNIV